MNGGGHRRLPVVVPGWLVPAIAGLIGALAMTFTLGPSYVDPTNHEWLMHHDYGLHFLGWHLYRGGPWTWPIGETPLLIWPIGSSIGLTDSIPIAAFLFKPLDAILPPIFQFIGLWWVLCFALQGVFGALLMQLATPRPSLQLLGAVLFILSPPIIFRLAHAALMAHWLLLASLWLYLRDEADAPSVRLAAGWALLCAAAAAIQPYILLMVLVLLAAAHGRQFLMGPRRVLATAASGALALAATWLSLWQSGSLMVRADDGLEIGGFGFWSTNMLSLVMPTEGGSLFAPGPIAYAHPGQYEGYAYLGAGTLLLGAIVAVVSLTSVRSWRWPRRMRQLAPLWVGVIFLAVMAVGPIVTWGPHTLFGYDVAWWGPMTIFRTHGRMIWPLFYTLVVAILFTACRFAPRRALAAVALAVVVQVVDLAGMVRHVRSVHSFGFHDPLLSPFWRVAPKHYQRLILVPTNLCPERGFIDYLPFQLLAGREGLAINAGATARYDVRKAEAYCDRLGQEFHDGLREEGSLYVVRRDLLDRLAEYAGGQSTCTMVDGYGVCFAPDSVARWQHEIDLPRSRLPDRDEFVRFYETLDRTYRDTLGRAPRDAPAPPAVRVELLARYLAYRMEGCADHEAETRTLEHLAGRPTPGLCRTYAQRHEMPPADQTLAFGRRLDEALSAAGGHPPSPTHVDLEGEAVWLQAYAKERARGVREQDARTSVLAAIAAAAR